jgi:hypothetical protein
MVFVWLIDISFVISFACLSYDMLAIVDLYCSYICARRVQIMQLGDNRNRASTRMNQPNVQTSTAHQPVNNSRSSTHFISLPFAISPVSLIAVCNMLKNIECFLTRRTLLRRINREERDSVIKSRSFHYVSCVVLWCQLQHWVFSNKSGKMI